jgi:hypothetical protein
MVPHLFFRPVNQFPRQANCVVELPRELGLERRSIRPLPAPSSDAGRFGGLYSDRAVRAPARRLGISVWQIHTWTKEVTNSPVQRAGAKRIQNR